MPGARPGISRPSSSPGGAEGAEPVIQPFKKRMDRRIKSGDDTVFVDAVSASFPWGEVSSWRA
jgi:hypothetical protein